MELYENKNGMYWHIELEEIVKRYIDESKELKARIDKAIEYIEHLDNVFIDSKEQDNIVNILKGDNK